MPLTHLSLTNIRCFESFDLDLPRQLVVTGPNGQGKSTLIEAISLLALTRSHRARHDGELIRTEPTPKTPGVRAQETPGVTATVAGTLGPRQIVRIALTATSSGLAKQANRFGRLTPLTGIVGLVRTVLFTPEELELLTGPPRLRRRLLDGLLLQRDGPPFAEQLLTFHRTLRQRNRLLATKLSLPDLQAQIAPWDTLYVAAATAIVAQRTTLLTELAAAAARQLAAMQLPLELAVSYQATVPEPERLDELLVARLERDQALGSTSIGPHRDDVVITVNGRPMTSASRGEQRAVLVALKLAEYERLAAADPTIEPIFLVDDVMSELDPDRRALIAAHLLSRPCVITTADPGALPSELAGLPRYELT